MSTISQGWFSCALAGTPVASCSDTVPGAYKLDVANTSAITNPLPYAPNESCANNGCPAFSQDNCGWTAPRSYSVNWVYPYDNPTASQQHYLYVCVCTGCMAVRGRVCLSLSLRGMHGG